MKEARHLLADVEFTEGAYQAAEGADALVILTEWDQFRALDLRRMKGLMNRALMVDLRNVYRPQEARGDGFDYVGVGKP
jgi:UDPglucose 6-dehydrogenase